MALTYTTIADSAVDADSPITTGLVTALRDNPLASRKLHVLTADQTYNNDATVNDTTMGITVVGGTTWVVHASLAMTLVNSIAGFRIKLVTPDPTNDVGRVNMTIVCDDHTTNYSSQCGYGLINADITVDNVLGSSYPVCTIDAYVTLDATPASGDIELWASQKDAVALDTVVLAGSFMWGMMVDV